MRNVHPCGSSLQHDSLTGSLLRLILTYHTLVKSRSKNRPPHISNMVWTSQPTQNLPQQPLRLPLQRPNISPDILRRVLRLQTQRGKLIS